MKPSTRVKVKNSTQEHLQIHEIIDDIVITKSRKANLIIQTSAVNFDLLSEYEQDNKIGAFSGLLNSLTFPVQVVIRTKRIDISNYINYLQNELKKPMSEGLRKQMSVYTTFVQNLVVQNDVLDKKFYIVVPHMVYNLSLSSILPLPKKDESTGIGDTELEKLVEQAKIYLYPKRDHLLKQIARMGLIGHQLENDELIELFYSVYNEVE